jgi:glycogen debranching enzyme
MIRKAEQVLINNDIDGKSTKPSPRLYPHQWFWDSCFIAIGYSHFDISRAKKEIKGILEGQWKNGMIPHIKFNPKAKNYYPSPKEWNIPEDKLTSGITQPAMLAIAVWDIYQKDKDKKFLREVFPFVKKYHEYLYKERGGGLIFIIHPWESGMDNTPVHDPGLNRVEIDKYIHLERHDKKVIDPSQRPSEEYYLRYMGLLKLFKENEYNIARIKEKSEFIVEDLLMNCIWCEANHCLSLIAKEIEEEYGKFLKWSKETKEIMRKKLFSKKFYYSYDVKAKRLIKKYSCMKFIPLFSGIATEEQAKIIFDLIDEFDLGYPIASYWPKASEFSEKLYWRGPVWININWFLIKGLKRYGYDAKAEEIRQKTIELIEKNGFFEYFNPKTGEGYGEDNFSWTAALYIDLKS